MHKAHAFKKLTENKKKKNMRISRKRSPIERVFGTLKRTYGFFRTRYLGIIKTRGQFLFSAIAYNLKKASTYVI